MDNLWDYGHFVSKPEVKSEPNWIHVPVSGYFVNQTEENFNHIVADMSFIMFYLFKQSTLLKKSYLYVFTLPIWQVSQNVVQACRQFGLHTLVCFEMLTEVKKKKKLPSSAS